MNRRIVLLTAMGAALTGCSATAAPPSASPRAVRAASMPQVPPLAIGVFRLAPGLPPGSDRAVGLRAFRLLPPNKTSFAAYLGETLAEQLRLAGKLDSSARFTVSADLIENSANPKIGQATGALAAIFRVTENGVVRMEKTLRVEASWNSSFIGAVAIDAAEREYIALYSRLVETLLEDPDFRRTVAGKS
ncbi:MAG: hypothetical protein ACK4GG_02075 [Sphingomonas sp.]